jgi:hypothetical protein
MISSALSAVRGEVDLDDLLVVGHERLLPQRCERRVHAAAEADRHRLRPAGAEVFATITDRTE